MEAVIVPLSLRGRLGDDGTVALETWVSDTGQMWRDEVLTLAEERFERRLAQEMSGLRVEMANGMCGIRREMSTLRVELLKWSFLFWIGQVAAMAGLLAMALRLMER
jgi:hypothetical protein